MHPELLAALAAERRRDLIASRVLSARRVPPGRPAWRVPRLTLPRFRVSWTRTTLAAVAGSRRGRSVVIVISATRTWGSAADPAAAGPSDRASLVKAL